MWFVLVHGVCHGAWTWYKVKPLLEAAGHSVIAVDLAASGISTIKVEEIQSLKDYSKPLLEVLSSFGGEEKVIMVAHSMGGISAALAADIFPDKIAAIVFLTATMPDTKNPPTYAFEKLLPSCWTPEELSDTAFRSYTTHDRPLHTILFGPKFMAKKLYQLCSVEDLELAKLLVRENPALAIDNLAGTRAFSDEGYGSVTRVYIICGEDNLVRKEHQRLIISNFPPKEVIEIKDADHMPMFSKPQELCACLLEIAEKYT
ncbi:hypothetical protein N665_0069s0041 [Sinapis alba]|nr:hypothetical protein N665_0069s0041 [Sinapis alba]